MHDQFLLCGENFLVNRFAHAFGHTHVHSTHTQTHTQQPRLAALFLSCPSFISRESRCRVLCARNGSTFVPYMHNERRSRANNIGGVRVARLFVMPSNNLIHCARQFCASICSALFRNGKYKCGTQANANGPRECEPELNRVHCWCVYLF